MENSRTGPVSTAVLHYTAPPVVGGVEAVIAEHAKVFLSAGYPVHIIAGSGSAAALPAGSGLTVIPEMHTQHLEIQAINRALEQGQQSSAFEEMRALLANSLQPVLEPFDTVIIHNILTKHFNLPLTAALLDLVEAGAIRRCIAWCHDISWTSPNSRSKVFPGFPWDLLRTPHEAIRYVTISRSRQGQLATLFGMPRKDIKVIYNGVDPVTWYGLNRVGEALCYRLGLLSAGLILLMPVRVTRAKNIELAMQVVAALKQLGKNPRLVITGPPDPHEAGGKDYYQELLHLREGLNLQDAVRFVYESGPDGDKPYTISRQVVASLLRMSDVLLMPSFREGFGMPVLEAGLLGIPVVCSNKVPVARDIGRDSVTIFQLDEDPGEIARKVTAAVDANPAARLRRRVRRKLTWEALFHGSILPLVQSGE